MFIRGPKGNAWALALIPGKGAVDKKDSSEYITHVKKKKMWFLFLFLTACPSQPGLPTPACGERI